MLKCIRIQNFNKIFHAVQELVLSLTVDGRTHTAIIVQACVLCNFAYTRISIKTNVMGVHLDRLDSEGDSNKVELAFTKQNIFSIHLHAISNNFDCAVENRILAK